MTEPSHAVFLSYASQDAAAAQRIAEALRAVGVEVWFDQSELRGGDVWDQSIRRQIKTCALFIPVISRHTHERAEGYFRLEWKLAVDRSHLIMANKAFLLPVVIDDSSDHDEHVPERFHEVQWTRLLGGETPPAFVERIKRLLGPEGSLATTSTSTATGLASGPIPALPGRRSLFSTAAVWGVGAIAVIAVAYFVADKFFLSKHSVTPASATAPAADQSATTPGITAPFNPPPHSIAVLPFVNMSGDKDQEYFSDGLTEELIDHLTRVSGLKVIARTSSFQFKGRNEDARSIAAKLAVANLLEGSVRRSGKTLRVTAQLVRASDGSHSWSHTYDRTFTDIFKIQDEIAESVTHALNVALTPAAAPTFAPTSPQLNFEAYNLVLEGNFYKARMNATDMNHAIVLYKQAIQLDPHYALPWARLGSAHINQVWQHWAPVNEGLARARAAVERAIELDSNLALAHYTMGGVHATELDWAGAVAELVRVREIDPDNKQLLPLMELDLYGVSCRFPDAIRVGYAILDRDPLNSYVWSTLANEQFNAGQLEPSAGSFHRLIELSPGFAGAQSGLGVALAFAGRHAEALAATEKESDEESRLEALPVVYWAQGDRARSDSALQELITRHGRDAPYGVATVYAYRSNAKEALDWLDRADRLHDPNLNYMNCDLLVRSLRGEPRYQALLDKLHLTRMPAIP